jgi:DUF1680 family protein
MSTPGPVAPTGDALAAVAPLSLDAVVLDPNGHLGGWQQRSAELSLPHCIDNLESSGALGNLRHVAGRGEQPFTGMWFADSDVYKTLEAAAWTGGAGALRGFVDDTVELLGAAQDSDGYLNSWYQLDHPADRWRDLRWGHELYCAGHLIQAAVAADRTGANGKLIEIATRFADLLVERFGPDGQDGICGHPEIETALVELYRQTGRRAYLDLAGRMIDLRGHRLLDSKNQAADIADRGFGLQYFQDHEPVRVATAATGHAVRQLYLEAGVVDVAVETGDAELLAASERIWDDLFATKTYLTGAHGSRHRDEAIGDAYELPSDRAYAETCAAIASFHWNWRLLLATGRHRYADEMERVLYNAIAVSTAVDGRHFFYSNPLQLRAGHDGSDEDAPSQRLSWYRCSCCPPNLARLLASLPGYLATTDPSGVQLHLYASATVRTSTAVLHVRTDYPWDGRIAITVDSAASEPWTLALRVPAWCADAFATIDGEPVEVDVEAGYLRLHRAWPASSTIVLELAMPVRLIAPHPRVDALRGCVALARGPLVYCVEQVDAGTGVVLDDIRLDPTEAPTGVVRDDLLDVPVAIAARAVVMDDQAPSPIYSGWQSTTPSGRPIELTAIPYYRWANREPGAMRVWLPVAVADVTKRSPS